MSTTTTLNPRPHHRDARPVAPLAMVQGSLALDLTPCLDPPRPEARPGRPGCDLVEVSASLRQELEQWVERYTQAATEIVAGDRPAAQLLRWTRADVHQDLVRRAVLVAHAGRREPGQGRPPGVTRARVHGVRLSFLSPETVEAAVHLKHGARSRAVAGRFEVHRGRWICTALEFC
ncbi:Rv3235 family protein [Nocardioides daphniae]|uniref:Uncharacterized protein n=1 Tax=Nocardioides daphniae TaxID=402297 RepID=A0A4P7UCA7_9ACTN|nr:Rv3235 family protein [Nocardioides daphniae]QCC77832.1 hypothetical protein E2C04_12750 [Nocardioides daphniae]GGD27884.1 hypothetical protein GCM10007231_29230 [Nocardioides daphniae]